MIINNDGISKLKDFFELIIINENYIKKNKYESFSIVKKENHFNEFIKDKKILIYSKIDDKSSIEEIKKIFSFIIKNCKRNVYINISNLINKKIKEKEIISSFIELNILYKSGEKFNKKTKEEKVNSIYLNTNIPKKEFEREIIIFEKIQKVRMLQDMAPNILSISKYTNIIKKELEENKKIKVTIFDKKEIEKEKMNLILAVNSGSKNNAKVIISEFKNNPKTDKKIVIVGKGIIFDSGGYNLKTGRFMNSMKYDMSGAAISSYILSIVAKLNLKVNLSIVTPITDNLVDSNATLPESIILSHSGLSVEIGDTDAEGRLILADGISYASKKLKPSLIVDIATLTGTVVAALGHEYTGVWSTDEKNWKNLEISSKKVNEKVWRMPLDNSYIEHLRKNTFADISSWRYRPGVSDCNMAASWLNIFANKTPFLHLDIAGTAEINEIGMAPMVKTLVDFIENYFN